MATSSLLDTADLISAKYRTESLALPDVKRINNITKFMADPLNFDGDIKKLAARFENQAKQCQDVIKLLKEQVKAKTATLHQVKEDMLELQRQLKKPDATVVYVNMKTPVLVKFLDETEVNEYDVPTALERYNLKMSSLYGEILSLDSDVDHVSYLKNVANINSQYVKDWHKRDMAKKLQVEDPKKKEPENSFEPEEESDEEQQEFLETDDRSEEEVENKDTEETDAELQNLEDEIATEPDSDEKLPEQKVLKEKITGKSFAMVVKTAKEVSGEKLNEQKTTKNTGTEWKSFKLPEKKVSNEKKPEQHAEEKFSGKKNQATKNTEVKSPTVKVIAKKITENTEMKDKGQLPVKNVAKKLEFPNKVAVKIASQQSISKNLAEKNFYKKDIAAPKEESKSNLPMKNDLKKLGNCNA
ncbi:myosin-11 [Drosophila guanche]|uniref:Blast:Muscle M-line assembly protein unc-89 n=1 Tax=Drosophila guanche TaxID=7266 RepID=A0A3B0JWM0_DROGU|nr:myosin-11 [Drosophila guanche]SPP75478.1 blast:Muscle M-line assembly protein unc-89 [Drosophila guanche]